jgi:epoxyqueuosine reductase QueG|tara:strand:+ start:310 stop:2346 length:2037 start_codon:yes stop_codon:yes gene_type:complete
MKAFQVKEIAKHHGADLVGIASTSVLNQFPPDPNWAQTPERITTDAKSVIVIAKRIPVAGFRCSDQAPYHYMDVMVLRRLDKIGWKIVESLEKEGYPSIVSASNSTSWDLKRGTYGHLSMRHLAVEAGLGTLGLNLNLITPEFGPRIYLGAVLTDLKLEADQPMIEKVCIGESCSRCLYACPSDSVLHFAINKRTCSPHAQVTGMAEVTKYMAGFVNAERRQKVELIENPRFHQFIQGMRQVAGCFAACPRCHAVCPIGDDYTGHLHPSQRVIPEKTPDKIEKAASYQEAHRYRADVVGLNEWNIRWVGREDYRGTAVKEQRRKYRELQQKRADDAAAKKPSLTGTSEDVMKKVFKAPIEAKDIKEEALRLGADLVGIADGEKLQAELSKIEGMPTPRDVTEFDSNRIIVLAKRFGAGSSRIKGWEDTHKFYNDELAVSRLEDIALDMVYYLEDQGYPALLIPSAHVDPFRYENDPANPASQILSAPHAAAEAGLGTFGLNHQLITPQYGPRVTLCLVLSSVECVADSPIDSPLCEGPSCGRCLKACPADSVKHWDRDWASCERFRSPRGFHRLSNYLTDVIEEEEQERQVMMLRSRDSADLFEGVLRGVGVVSGCRRCQEVCPVGTDYDGIMIDRVDQIAEASSAKQDKLDKMMKVESEGSMPGVFATNERWIGSEP